MVCAQIAVIDSSARVTGGERAVAWAPVAPFHISIFVASALPCDIRRSATLAFSSPRIPVRFISVRGHGSSTFKRSSSTLCGICWDRYSFPGLRTESATSITTRLPLRKSAERSLQNHRHRCRSILSGDEASQSEGSQFRRKSYSDSTVETSGDAFDAPNVLLPSRSMLQTVSSQLSCCMPLFSAGPRCDQKGEG